MVINSTAQNTSMLKHLIIVYAPGYGGNFLQRLFSLGQETVPHLSLKELDTAAKIDNKTIESRLSSYRFSRVKQDYYNWQKFHRAWMGLEHYNQIMSKLDQKQFSHIVFAVHYPEYVKYKHIIDSVESFTLFCVDLDLNKYQSWLDQAQQELFFRYRLNELENYIEFSYSVSKEKHINLSNILNDNQGFLTEYNRFCELNNLKSQYPYALDLYEDWNSVRGL